MTSCFLTRTVDRASCILSNLQSSYLVPKGAGVVAVHLSWPVVDWIKDSIIVIVWKARRSSALVEGLGLEGSGCILDESMASLKALLSFFSMVAWWDTISSGLQWVSEMLVVWRQERRRVKVAGRCVIAYRKFQPSGILGELDYFVDFQKKIEMTYK